MKILILGASTTASIGYMVGEQLGAQHEVIYASRSGRLGVRCDISSPPSVRQRMEKDRPDVVIVAAGVFAKPRRIGSILRWDTVVNHLKAKTFGPLVVCNELLRIRKSAIVIVFGGRETSSHPGFAPFTLGNGALWSLVRFLNEHTRLSAYYIDLPFIEGSAMQKLFVRSADTKYRAAGMDGVSPNGVTKIVQRILRGTERRRRVVLGAGTV